MGVVLVGIPKQHAPHPPYVSPGRMPAFGWAEGTRMSVPAPTCFLPRQALPTRPGLCRQTPLHSARSGRACQLAGLFGCCAEVRSLSQNRTLDSVLFSGYNEHKERRCPQTVSPFGFAEITASLSQGGGYFFFVTSKTTVTTPRITRQNWNSSAYVTISIPPFLPKRGNPPSHAGANRLQPFVAAPCPYFTMAVLPSQEQERKCNSALRQYPFGPSPNG